MSESNKNLRRSIGFYKTWQEARSAAIALGIKKKVSYMNDYIKDPRLPSCPYSYYKDFPGMEIFLDKGFYKTWQEASLAAVRLGARNRRGYAEARLTDSKLPSWPYTTYEDFPGFPEFIKYGLKNLN